MKKRKRISKKKSSESGIVKIFTRKTGDKFPITFELQDGTLMVNATEMGKAFGETRKPVKFLRNKQTMLFINELRRSPDLDFGPNKLPYITVKGGSDLVKQGTWMHERLALKYAAWIAPSFENWVYENITELLKTGKVELDRPNVQGIEEHLNPQVQKQNSLLVAKEVYRQTKGDVKSIPQYYYDLTMKLTGVAPRGWQKLGRDSGLKPDVTRKGGREVIRVLKPELACAISLADNILTSQKHLKVETDLQYVVDQVKKGIEMFDGLIKLGVHPVEETAIKKVF